MSGTMSVSGLVSGMKTDDIISKIMEVAKKPQQRLETQKENAELKKTAWQTLNTKVLAMQAKSFSISRTSTFLTKTATSSDDTIATATAGTNALPGIYDIKVSSRAQSHQIASQTYTSMDADIGNGTFKVAFKNGENLSITVNQDNNSLVGLRDSINRANGGVTATVVNQGTDTDPQYRLLLTSNETGTDHEMTVTADGLDINMDQQVQAAKNAEVTLGSGTNAITVNKNSNTITDLIPGVTLNVSKADAENPITVTVSKDTSSTKTAIQDFVTQFNDLMSTIDTQFTYDADTGETPILFGDYQLQVMQNDITDLVTGNASGVTGKYSALSSIGITLGTNGQLTVDSTQLDAALDDDTNAVARLFGADLTSDSSLVRYATSTSDTQASTGSGWPVDITQPATRAQLTAGMPMDNPLSSDEYLIVNGKKISLTAGMSADEVVSAINSQSSKTSVSAYKSGADGTGTGNYISLRASNYGSKSTFTISSNQPLTSVNTTGFGIIQVSPTNPAGESGNGNGSAGMDVAGTINGQTCTGNAQLLTATPAKSTDPTNGLAIICTSTKAMQTSVGFSKGICASLQDLLTKYTTSGGTFADINTSLTDEIDSLTDDIATWEDRITAQSDSLYEKFSSMESQLSDLQSQGEYISAMFSSSSK